MTSLNHRSGFVHSSRLPGRWLILLCICTALVSHHAAAQEVDENLFLLGLLESQYNLWPENLDDPNQFVIDLRELRDELIRTRTYIQSQPELDQRLAESYTEALALLDAYRVTVGELAGIDIDLNADAIRDIAAASINAVARGVATGEPTVGTVVGGASLVVDLSTSGPRREHNAQMKIDAAVQAYLDRTVESFQRCQLLGASMTRDHGWSPGEAGFEDTTAAEPLILKLIEAEDYAGMVALAQPEAAARPQDLFTQAAYQSLRTLVAIDSPRQLLGIAQDTAALVDLIPKGEFYDSIRYNLADLVSDFSVGACTVQYLIDGKASPTSKQAAQLSLEQALIMRHLDPDDYAGYTRCVHGLILVLNDQPQEAIRLFREIEALYGEDTQWLFWMACARSMQGNHPLALELLERSIANGQWDLELIRAMPHMRPLSNAMPDAFAKLVTPQWTWNFTDDWMWDDVTMTNTSSFPLTTITLTVNLVQGHKSETLSLELDLLMPGETHTWTDAVDGPYGKWDDTSTASLQCDQMPRP